jgi:hypothetical protein
MPKRFKVMLVVLAGLAVVIVALWGGSKLNNTSQDTKDIRRVLHRQEMIFARNECRNRIESQFADVIQHRDALGWAGIPGIVLYHSDTSGELNPALVQIAVELKAANDAVLALPSVDDAVEHGYTLDGVKYPACPKGP